MPVEIKCLRIERFRGIDTLTWRPDPRTNVLLGGGNVGKTTILDAIGLLLSPSTSYTLVDADYLNRDVEREFSVEAVISLPGGAASRQSAMAWPWEWNGQDADQPRPVDSDEPAPAPRPPVYRVRVRGTKDFELVYEIVQPDDTCVSFSAGLRREIGLVRLTVDDRNDRDLRLVQGSSLDRLLNDRGLRARLGREIATDSVDRHLQPDSRARLEDLDRDFTARQLPGQLGLAFTGSSGVSINSLVGLTASKGGIVLPMSTWGSGTRRLAALAIAGSGTGR
jgi:putative ATP-dependent endonuclease of the OLD family